MPDITKPLPFDELALRPPLTGRIRLGEEVGQSLSLLSGYDGRQRKLVRLSPSGILYTASPAVSGVINITADQAGYQWPSVAKKITDVLIRAALTNGEYVWVNIDNDAGVNTGWPLEAGEWLNLTVTSLMNLHIYIVTNTDKAIVIYSE